MNPEVLKRLREIVGDEYVLDEPEDRITYSYDATPSVEYAPDAVIRPGRTEEIAEVLRLANAEGFKVVPRGAGTNLSGGSVARYGGVMLVTNRMNRILEVDAENLTGTVQAGAITADFQAEVERIGLFYPPDPGSNKVCTIGGNVAENAGGLRGLKYGVTKDYVLGLEVVLPTGEVLRTGGKSVKDVAGYNLTQLMVGSEGTLGIVTEVTLKLIPLPEAKRTLLAFYSDVADAARTVSAILAARIVPSTMELLDQVTIRCVEEYAHIGLPIDIAALLLLEVDGRASEVEEDASKVEAICREQRAARVRLAASGEEAERLTEARRSALAALARRRPTTILEDATVPRSKVAEMVAEIRRIAERHRVQIGIFGHAGDGNLHPTCMTDERDEDEMARVHVAFEEIFKAALRLGGTITGEHGIGLSKARFLPLRVGDAGMETMRRIKRSLDPNGVLNPGKMALDG